jgi:uncharacterized protein YbjT (DUF2867 family)
LSVDRQEAVVPQQNRTILITGATGKQGGALINELAGADWTLRAMTRHPNGDAAEKLRARGVEVVAGDLDDAASLKTALQGAWGVFGVQNTWEAGVEREEEQGQRLAEMAREAGVQHFVYASVGSADRHTGIPHFENKARVEATVRALNFPSHVIYRPVFFMENLTSPWFLNGDAVYSALEPSTVLQMIAVSDIGKYAAAACTNADALNGRAFDIAGDARTMPEVAEVLGRALGRTIKYVQIPLDEIRKNSDDFAVMLDWFNRVGYDVDIETTSRELGIAPTCLEEWAKALR